MKNFKFEKRSKKMLLHPRNQYACHDLSAWNKRQQSLLSQNLDPSRTKFTRKRNIHWIKQHFGTREKSCVAYRPAFYTPNCSRSHKGLAPREIISREIWERFQLIDISTVWHLESNYLKRAKRGRKRVVKEMITGSLSLPSFSSFSLRQIFACLLLSRLFPTIWEPGTN